MPNRLIEELESVRVALAAGESGADTAMFRLTKSLLAADPEETLTATLESRTERCLIAGWIASRLAWLARERSDLVFLETAATLIATMADRPRLAAAYANALERWPTQLPRLVVACKERINGTGQPFGWTTRTLTYSQQRVALGYEAARRLSASQGKLAAVIAGFESEATQGYWDKALVSLLPGAMAGISMACDDRRLEPVRSKSYRISPAHTTEELTAPRANDLSKVKRRQKIASRQAGFNPGSGSARVKSAPHFKTTAIRRRTTHEQ